ncbi:MAG: PAS domain-containing sensor histidine kinase [Robiginitomaculum sp.]|nr:PAS domain-containing sensor histidine kinase [Robiginitomaculum sp.]
MTGDKKTRNRQFRTPKVFRTALFGVFFTIAATLTGIGALMALSGDEGQAADALPGLWLNLVLILILGVYLFFRLRKVLFSSDADESAPHLHRRFVMIFSLGALLPAILVGLFFTALMTRNLSDIFGPTVRQTMQNSREVSNAYLREEIDEISQGGYEIAEDLNRAESTLPNRITFTAFLISQAVFREFPVVYVIDGDGRILSQAEGPQSPVYILPSSEAMSRAKEGSMTITSRNEIDLLVALYKLENFADAYLYTGRYLREGVLANIDKIDEVDAALDSYEGSYKALNNVFLLTYIEVALLIFFAAIWLALLLANRIVSPLGEMVNAAEKVRAGNLAARVNVTGVWDEIGDLANAFNRMTRQLHTQREDLVLEHDISEQRREFSEAVLSGVSAGVIGLTPEGKITVINKSAENLLGLRAADVVGAPLSLVVQSFLPVFTRAKDDIDNRIDDQVVLETSRGTKNLDIRISSYKGDQPETGWVITFDDITRLVAAQRHSAWREVARRIAHEIKNPLTPIQLSAERLEKKFKSEITSDPEVFSNCTRTIVRQVSNLGRMVDEFSAFARMPAPILEPINLHNLLKETLFAAQVGFPDIQFSYDKNPGADVDILCDERLISQALTNIYKNAGEAISRRIDDTGQEELDGVISTDVSVVGTLVCIDITDNGQGWPEQDRERLLEPYMTTRDEGSGLGLAIVKRIAEDHGGSLELVSISADKIGARVRICLPKTDEFTEPLMPSAHKITNPTGEIVT